MVMPQSQLIASADTVRCKDADIYYASQIEIAAITPQSASWP